MIWKDVLFDDENAFIDYKHSGLGRGKCKAGKRKTWTKQFFFETDLFKKNIAELGEVEFTRKFAGYTPSDVQFFWQKIKHNVIRSHETEVHARNKLLMWLDKLHNKLKWKKVQKDYKIGTATAILYVKQVLTGIIKSFANKNVITFPNEAQRKKMVELNKIRNIPMPHGLYTMDGKHAKCLGHAIRKRMSHKFKFHLPCFNVLFVIERTFGTVCAFNLDESAVKHDITILRESAWFQNLNEVMNGWIIMADKGYLGAKSNNIAAAFRRGMSARDEYSPQFWQKFNIARGDSERVFAHFFYNKFSQLGDWRGIGKRSFDDWALNVTCCIILYNIMKLRHAKSLSLYH